MEIITTRSLGQTKCLECGRDLDAHSRAEELDCSSNQRAKIRKCTVPCVLGSLASTLKKNLSHAPTSREIHNVEFLVHRFCSCPAEVRTVEPPNCTHRASLLDLLLVTALPRALAIHELGIKAEMMQTMPAAIRPQENIG